MATFSTMLPLGTPAPPFSLAESPTSTTQPRTWPGRTPPPAPPTSSCSMEHRLVYRGQFDASRPGSAAPVTGHDLRRAIDAVLAAEPVPAEQYPSLGCSIKWRRGNEPSYG